MPPYAFAMAKWHVGFDGRWRESFHDFDEAVAWAREVAETGRTVDVAQRVLLGRKLVAVFPESERDKREALWSASTVLGLGGGAYAGVGGDFGGGGGGGDGGGGGGC